VVLLLKFQQPSNPTTQQPNNPTTQQPKNQATKKPNNQETKQPKNQTTQEPNNPRTKQPKYISPQKINIKIENMGTISNFEELEIWQKSRLLARNVYTDFKDNQDFGFRNQIQRCSVSVMNNIAEGFCRKGNKEFHYFLNIAKASCGELKSMYYLAEDIKFVSNDVAETRRREAMAILKSITKLMCYLRNKG